MLVMELVLVMELQLVLMVLALLVLPLTQERLEAQAVNQAGVLVYTSGTTGNPKGVMLSQVLDLRTCHKYADWP